MPTARTGAPSAFLYLSGSAAKKKRRLWLWIGVPVAIVAAGAVAAIIKAGRTVDRATIETTAARILQGDDTPGGQDLTRYDKYMEE